MRRTIVNMCFLALLAIGWIRTNERPADASQGGESTTSGVSGQGKMRFRVLFTSDRLPQEAQAVLKGAHGGFAVDLRPGKGETYFSLKGAGILQISSDMKKVRLLDTAPEMKDTNLHNTGIWYAQDGTPFLMFPGNEANKVFTTRIDGKLVHTLNPPDPGTDVGHPVANEYFAGQANKFFPTDVEQLDGLMYMTTGYS
jgi:hypothetical protein